MAKGLVGRFLLLKTGWCETHKEYEGGLRLQFAPTMTVEDARREYDAGSDYTMPDGKKAGVIRAVSDWDGLLSWLMGQVMTDDRGIEVPAMQSLTAVMLDAYDHGATDQKREARKVEDKYWQEMNETRNNLNETRRKLAEANGRAANAQKTIKALQAQLEALKPAEAKPTPETAAEPMPEIENTEAVTTTTYDRNVETSELPGNENDSDQ